MFSLSCTGWGGDTQDFVRAYLRGDDCLAPLCYAHTCVCEQTKMCLD